MFFTITREFEKTISVHFFEIQLKFYQKAQKFRVLRFSIHGNSRVRNTHSQLKTSQLHNTPATNPFIVRRRALLSINPIKGHSRFRRSSSTAATPPVVALCCVLLARLTNFCSRAVIAPSPPDGIGFICNFSIPETHQPREYDASSFCKPEPRCVRYETFPAA